MTVSSQSSHHPQEVLLAQFSLYVHKGGLKPDSFHFFIRTINIVFFVPSAHLYYVYTGRIPGPRTDISGIWQPTKAQSGESTMRSL